MVIPIAMKSNAEKETFLIEWNRCVASFNWRCLFSFHDVVGRKFAELETLDILIPADYEKLDQTDN